MIVLEARSRLGGGALNFVQELFPRLGRLLSDAGEQVVTVTGHPRSVGERLRRRVDYERASVIFHTGNRATFAPRARQLVLVTDRSLLPMNDAPPLPFRQTVRRVLLRHALIAADALAVPTAAMVPPLDEVRDRLPFAHPNTPVHVVPYGRPDWDAPDARPMHDPVRVLLPGYLSWHKNFTLLSDVLPLVNDLGVMFALTAAPDEIVEGRRLGDTFAGVDRVRFLGQVTRSRLPELYASHDIALVPSLYESFGFPLVEAMTMGMPLVASDRDWAREVCADGAIYADPRDPEAWAGALRSLVEGGVRRNDAGLERCLDFDWDLTAERFAVLLLEL